MKHIIFITMLFFLSLSAQSKDDKDGQGFPLAFSAGPIIKINGLGDGVIATLGGRVNSSWGYLAFGVGGYGAVGQSKLNIDGKAEDVSYSYGGLGLGVRLFPDSFIHLTNFNTLGLGMLTLKNRGESGFAYSIEPELNAEIDIFSRCRIGTGISYRFMFSNKVSAPSKDLNGFGWQFFIELGYL